MEHKKRVFTVLAIDGGGVRGVIPARILEELEAKTGKPICELFDMVGGTSTGAILAAGITVPDPNDPTKPKFTASDLKDFYYTYAGKIFPELMFKSLRQLSSSAAYDPKPLEDALEKHYGDARMKDSMTHLFIPATDIKNFRPVLMKHIKGVKDDSPEQWSTLLLKDAVRATTTAPTYFPARYYQTTPHEDLENLTHRHAMIDGGFFGGHLARRLLTHAKKLAPPDAEIVIVHLGTGNPKISLSPEEWNKLGPLGMISKSKGSILMSLSTHMVNSDVSNDLRDEIGDRFMSFDGEIDFENPKNNPSIAMDDASPANLKRLERQAEDIMKDNAVAFERLCTILEQRTWAEIGHQESKESLQSLVKKLEDCKTVKTLSKTYQKIVEFAADLDVKITDDEDKTLQTLAKKLSPHHREELDRLYNVIQDKLENQSQIGNSMRETGDNFGKFMKKIGLGFNDKSKKPPANDDEKKPPEAQAKKAGSKAPRKK